MQVRMLMWEGCTRVRTVFLWEGYTRRARLLTEACAARSRLSIAHEFGRIACCDKDNSARKRGPCPTVSRAAKVRHHAAVPKECRMSRTNWQAGAHASGPILVATLPSSLSGTEYACIDLCVETHPEWQAENVCVWYRRLPGAETEVFAMQEACPHAGISLVESDIEDFRSTDLGTSLQGPCIACPAHAFVFDAGSGRCLTNPSTPNARTHSAGGTRSCYACPLPLLGRLAFARLPCDRTGCLLHALLRSRPAILAGTRRGQWRRQGTSRSSCARRQTRAGAAAAAAAAARRRLYHARSPTPSSLPW